MNERYKWMVLSSTSLSVLMATLNGGTLIIALPELLRDLHASLVSILWVVMIYSLATSVLLLNIGRLSDVLGRKNLYNLGFLIFTLAALFSGMSANVGEIIFFRAVQGIGGALLMGIGTALITDVFPTNQRGTALGINSMVAAVGQMAGPIIGGLLVSIGWRWVFWFNVPIGLAATIWSFFTLKETGVKDQIHHFDFKGTALYLLGIVSLLVVLSFGGIYGWGSTLTLALSATAVVCTVAFIWVEKTTAEPLLDLSLFSNLTFSMGNLSVLLNSIARMSVTFLLTFYFQGAKGFSALEAGILLIPMAAAMFVTAPISGKIADRYGSYWLSALGLAISGFGLIGMAMLKLSTPYWILAGWMCLLGGGSGFFNSPNTSAIMGTVPATKRGVAAGTRSMFMNIGAMVSIALALAVTSSSLPADVMLKIFADEKIDSATAALGNFIHGLDNAFWLSASLTLVATVVSLLRNKSILPQETNGIAVDSK